MKTEIYILFILTIGLSSYTCNKFNHVDEDYVNYIIDGKYENAYSLIDTNIAFKYPKMNKQKYFSQFRVAQKDLEDKSIQRTIIDTFMLGTFHGITSRFSSTDSSSESNLEVFYVLELQKIVFSTLVNSDNLLEKSRKINHQKIDATNFKRPEDD